MMIGGKLRSEGLEILCGGGWGAGRAVGESWGTRRIINTLSMARLLPNHARYTIRGPETYKGTLATPSHTPWSWPIEP